MCVWLYIKKILLEEGPTACTVDTLFNSTFNESWKIVDDATYDKKSEVDRRIFIGAKPMRVMRFANCQVAN